MSPKKSASNSQSASPDLSHTPQPIVPESCDSMLVRPIGAISFNPHDLRVLAAARILIDLLIAMQKGGTDNSMADRAPSATSPIDHTAE